MNAADSYSGRGLRAGLVAVLNARAAEDYMIETETDLLWVGLYYLTDMVKAGDEQFASLIAEALHKGLSWADIGEALGISKQAAHKRYARRVRETLAAAEFDAEFDEK